MVRINAAEFFLFHDIDFLLCSVRLAFFFFFSALVAMSVMVKAVTIMVIDCDLREVNSAVM